MCGKWTLIFCRDSIMICYNMLTLKVVELATFLTSGGKRVIDSVQGRKLPSVCRYSPDKRHKRTL